MAYYIDGTIDSIKIGTGAASIEFSLLPSSEFLKTMAEGKKKALFINKQADSAYLENVDKNESEKDIVRFSIAAQKDSSLKCLLLETKNSRNIVRVFVEEKADKTGVDLPTAATLQIM